MGKGMQYFERGLYSIAEASKLTGIDSRSVSRWLQGYRYKRSGKLRESPPVIVSSTLSRIFSLRFFLTG
jgi:hypothetical protein